MSSVAGDETAPALTRFPFVSLVDRTQTVTTRFNWNGLYSEAPCAPRECPWKIRLPLHSQPLESTAHTATPDTWPRSPDRLRTLPAHRDSRYLHHRSARCSACTCIHLLRRSARVFIALLCGSDSPRRAPLRLRPASTRSGSDPPRRAAPSRGPDAPSTRRALHAQTFHALGSSSRSPAPCGFPR